MYWIISGPDNNPLTGEVLLQQDTGFWAHAAPVLSFSCSICSIGVALYVAYRARQLTQQQRDIAEQGRQIAQDKLNVDVFDKRYKIYLAYHDFYGQMVTKNYDNRNNIREDLSKFLQETSAQRIIFEIDDVRQLNEVKSRHIALFNFRSMNLDINKLLNSDGELFDDFQTLVKVCLNDSFIISEIIKNYTPKVLTSRPFIPKVSSASHPEP